jgi:hypothetical protein
MLIIDYIKGSANKGAIIIHDSKTHTAVTLASSKNFKSLKGAEKYMTKFGYIKNNLVGLNAPRSIN